MVNSKSVTVVGWEGKLVSVQKLREEGGGNCHIFYFRSPKNERVFIFCGVIPFIQAVLLEANPNIKSYTAITFGAQRSQTGKQTTPHEQSCIVATKRDGQQVAFEPRYTLHKRQGAGAQRDAKPVSEWRSQGYFDSATEIEVVTDAALSTRFIELDNWLMLCAAMNRYANRPLVYERRAIQLLMEKEGRCTVSDILSHPTCDGAGMLAALAHGLASGTLACDSTSQPIVRSSVVTVVGGDHAKK